ncbi:hypothetical protein [Corynebacterium sp. UBA2622]|uniref:hypothetical protein n=1 Tax=Corynebacterium sp. UBA2622 TaxID=1946393 RepID=UPI0025C411DA|nr:hypothetical protein [Corynebacterium sp. UBA2622]
MRRVISVVCAGSALVVSACSAGGSGEASSTVTSTEGVVVDPGSPDQPQPSGSAGPEQTFADVLANPGSVPVNPSARYDPDGSYGYAFTDVNADGVQDMLLRVNSKEFSPVVVLTADGKGGYTPSNEVLVDGASSAGGSRAQVMASQSGQGVYEVDYQSVQPERKVSQWAVQGVSLVAGPKSTYMREEDIPDAVQVAWLDTATRQLLYPDMPAPRPAPAAGAQAAGPGETALIGTVKEMTYGEMMEGKPTPNGEPAGKTKIILVLDTPQTFTAYKAGSMQTQESWAVTFGDQAATMNWERYLDQHVTVVVEDKKMSFPSGTDIPLGQLHIVDVKSVS